MSTDPGILLVGRSQAVSATTAVEIGRVSLEIEDRGLRNVRIDGVEVIRRLQVAIRDPAWDTLEGEPVDQRMEQTPDGLTCTFASLHRGGEIDFSWEGTFRVDAAGTVEFTMDGRANRAFDYARIGIVLLSPEEFGGLPYRVTTSAGLHGGVLPQAEIGAQAFVAGEYYPLTPAFSELSVFPALGEVRFQFEGDLFEIEDQRNWTDASFKTYSTPMSLGMRHAEEGGRIAQRMLVAVPPPRAARAAPRVRSGGAVALRPERSDAAAMPPVGLCHTLTDRALTAREQELLGRLGMAHLRVDVEAVDGAGLSAAAETARALGARLELAVHLTASTDRAELRRVEDLVAGAPVDRLLLFQRDALVTDGELTAALRARLGGHPPVFGGTDLNFAEVNRQRPDPATCDGVAFSITPQIHAFDERSLVETLAVQGTVVRSASSTFAKGVPVAVTVTLRPRFNPDAVAAPPSESRLPDAVDPRQPTLFCAAWTVASLKYLAEAGAGSVTYYGTAGWQGVIERDEGPPAPALFHSTANGVYPVYHVFRAVAEMPAAELVPVASSDPLAVVGLGLELAARVRLILANLTPLPQRVRVDEPPARSAAMCTLDEHTAWGAITEPERWGADQRQADAAGGIELGPYATAILDYGA